MGVVHLVVMMVCVCVREGTGCCTFSGCGGGVCVKEPGVLHLLVVVCAIERTGCYTFSGGGGV